MSDKNSICRAPWAYRIIHWEESRDLDGYNVGKGSRTNCRAFIVPQAHVISPFKNVIKTLDFHYAVDFLLYHSDAEAKHVITISSFSITNKKSILPSSFAVEKKKPRRQIRRLDHV